MKTVTIIKDGVLNMFGGLKVTAGTRMPVKEEHIYPLWSQGFIALETPPTPPQPATPPISFHDEEE